MKISIKKAKEIREELGLTHLVIFGIDNDGDQYVVTHGESKYHARQAAAMGNNLRQNLGWHEKYCHEKPLERICGNCEFVNDSVSGSGAHWYSCIFEVTPVSVESSRKACGNFEPKY